jgi:hypothetical protein
MEHRFPVFAAGMDELHEFKNGKHGFSLESAASVELNSCELNRK